MNTNITQLPLADQFPFLDKLLDSESKAEEILVGLTLIPKEIPFERMEEVFDFIPWPFVHRLLVSDPDMANVGVGIWKQFTSCCFNRTKLLKRISPLADLLASSTDITQANTILQGFIEIISHASAPNTIAETRTKVMKYFSKDILQKIARQRKSLVLLFIDEWTSHYLEAEESEVLLIDGPSIFLPCLSDFLLRQDSSMFSAFKTAIKLLAMPSCNLEPMFVTKEGKLLISKLKLSCQRILASKLSKGNSMTILLFIALMTNHTTSTSDSSKPVINFMVPEEESLELQKLQTKWIYQAEQEAELQDSNVDILIAELEQLQQTDEYLSSHLSQEERKNLNRGKKQSHLSPKQFLLMVTHLVCAEVRYVLDNTTTAMLEQDSLERCSLPLLYSVLESVVIFLVTDEEASLRLGQESLESLRTALTETFMFASAFLAERWDIFEEGGKVANEILDNYTTFYTISAYSSWLDVETSVIEEEVDRLVPLMIWMQSKRHLQNIDVYSIASGLLLMITSNSSSLDLFLSLNGLDYLITYFAQLRTISKQDAAIIFLVNIVASMSMNELESHSRTLQQLLVPLEGILNNWLRSEEKLISYNLAAQAIIVMTILLRSNTKKYQVAISLPHLESTFARFSSPFLSDESQEYRKMAMSGLKTLSLHSI